MRPLPADSQRHQMTNGGTFVRFVLHFQNVASGKKKRLILKLIFNTSENASESH